VEGFEAGYERSEMTFKFLARLGAVIGAACAVCVFVGCANATFHMNEDAAKAAEAAEASGAATQAKFEARHANFFSGFGQRHTIQTDKICGGADKVASVEVDQSLIDAVIATVTLGIYTPLTARVYCK
jgi:hypothetical protein